MKVKDINRIKIFIWNSDPTIMRAEINGTIELLRQLYEQT